MRLDISRKMIRVCMALMIFFALPLISFAAGDPSESLQAVNGIPLVIIYVNENADEIAAATEAAIADNKDYTYGTIQDMNTSEDHSIGCIGSVKIVLPGSGIYAGASVPEGQIPLKYIKGRGNYTWNEGNARKKPYKIKFEKSQDLFGLGKDKDWALLANDLDKTLIRNRITSWLGDEIGLPFTPQSVPADVVMIGFEGDSETYREYLGSYTLSELVDIGKGRINIKELDPSDMDPDVISGGYLLAIYNDNQDKDIPVSTYFRLDSGIKMTNKNPEFINEEGLEEGQRRQREYIREYVQNVDDLIMRSEEITPEIHKQIDSLIDLRSLADYWWVQEFSANSDGFFTGSTYLYKDRGKKLYMGPLWDFDIAWLHISDKKKRTSLGFNITDFKWTDALREKDPLFVDLLKDRWNDPDTGMDKRLREITDQGGIIDQYMSVLSDSWTANNELMNRLHGDKITNYAYDTDWLRTWIINRRKWINDNLDSIGKVHFTISYEDENGDVFYSEKIRGSEPLYLAPEAPEKEGYVFMGWKEKETGADHKEYTPYEDVTFVPAYARDNEVTAPEELFFAMKEVWASLEDGVYMNSMKVLPDDAVIGKISWTSSDRSVAVINQYGYPDLIGTGDTVITATLRNGVSRSYTLHVYDPNKTPAAYPQSVRLPDMTLKVGETGQLIPEFVRPGNAPVPYPVYSFKISGVDKVKVIDDEKGIIKGLAPGKAEVTFKLTFAEENSPVLTAKCTVTVAGAPQPLAAPSVSTTAAYKKKQMKVTLGTVKGAAGYQVAYRKAGTGSWKTITTKGNTAVISKLKKGGLYQIRAAAIDNNKKAGRFSNIEYRFFRDMEKPRFKAGKSSIKATWKKAKGASGYQILISESKNLKGASIITVKGKNKKSYTIKGLKKGKRYYAAVRPYKTKGGKRYIGIRCKIKSLKVK